MTETSGDESQKVKDVNEKACVVIRMSSVLSSFISSLLHVIHDFTSEISTPWMVASTSVGWLDFVYLGVISVQLSVRYINTDIAKIPCFKSTFLNAIGGGTASFIATLFITSDITRSHRYGFTTFILVACGSWILCRYSYNQKLIDTNKINKAISEKSKKKLVQIDNVDGENVAKKS